MDIEDKLKDENLELKLSAIRTSIEATNIESKKGHDEVMNELHEILQHVKKTNGSVAYVTERLSTVEEDNKLHKKDYNDLKDIVTIESKQTKPWRIITSNKWVLILLLTFVYLLGSNDFRELLFGIISKIR